MWLHNLFLPCQENSNRIVKTGALIFDPSFSYILAVKGTTSQKWGPPKGHLQPNETLIHGAFREVLEETGLVFHFPQETTYLPRVTIEGVRLFIVVIPRNSDFIIRDQSEVAGLEWFNLRNAGNSSKLQISGNSSNSQKLQISESQYDLTKVMHRVLRRQPYLKSLAMRNMANYDLSTVNHFYLNRQLFDYLQGRPSIPENLSIYHHLDQPIMMAQRNQSIRRYRVD